MEISLTLSMEEKSIAMKEWWTKAHDLIVGYKLDKNQITQMVAEVLTFIDWPFYPFHDTFCRRRCILEI